MENVLTIDPKNPDALSIGRAADIVRSGGVIAYPTETFYGLGADAMNGAAVGRIFAIKGRDFQKPLPVIIGRIEDLHLVAASVPEKAPPLMEKFWPGALTLLFPSAPDIPPPLTAATGKIGVRLSSHPIAKALCLTVGHPITATSANMTGMKECTTAQEVYAALGNLVDAIVDGGPTPGGLGSTIVDVTTDPPQVLRQGLIRIDRSEID
jgi:L-threonylcarbamoyladenylate synthase